MQKVNSNKFRSSSLAMLLSLGLMGACTHSPGANPAAGEPQASQPGVPQPIPQHAGEREQYDREDHENGWTLGSPRADRDEDGDETADHSQVQQRGQESDVEITREIRRAIIDDDDFSLYARNVTIDTRGGEVTLIGLVRSPDEKRRIEEIARNVAGEGNVISELTIDAH